MTSVKSVVAACAALAMAGCATNQATPTHRMSVVLVGAESADCISPQAVGEYAITAPGDLIVEPEAPNVEVICNAEGYQETYASFQEVYNDGSAGAIALGALAFGIMGAAITAGSDGLDSLPNRVTITMVPEGEVHNGSLAQGEYERASETVIATASLAPAYTAAEPPEGSEIAMARAKAVTSGDQVAAAQARDAELRQFETRLRGSRTQLTAMLNDYNRENEFATAGARPLTIKDVARVEAITAKPEGYVVRIVGNSGLNATWAADVYDELFLIDDSRGGLRILGHGQRLMDGRKEFQTAALAGSDEAADLERFETRLKGIKPQLTAMLNNYNREAEFAMGGARLLKIKDVSRVQVVTARPEGYVVRIVGNSGLNATWAADVYDELFLIESNRGGLRILGHGQQLAERQARATG